MRASSDRADPAGSLIVIGATPPPTHGSNVMTGHVIEAVRRAGRLAGRLETGEDQRPVFTTGRLDPTNIYYGLKHVALLLRLLLRHPRAAVYVPISQNRWGFTRDGLFIWLARAARRRVIAHLHGGLFGQFYASSPRLQRWLIARTFTAVSEAWVLTDAQRSIFDGLLPADRVRVLENAAEDMGADEVGEDNHLADRRVRVLFLSNLIPEKGYGDLLDALDRLIDRGVGGIDVRLVGEVRHQEPGRLRDRARVMARGGVRLEIVGPLTGEHKLAEYRWADIFALPSRYPPEGQPVVLLEAMSAGLPILSTDHSAIPLTVRDREQGLIVPPGDTDALADALERMVSDRALRQRLGAAGRERYEQRYAVTRFYAAVAGLLSDPA